MEAWLRYGLFRLFMPARRPPNAAANIGEDVLVGSADIIDGEVKNNDLSANSVATGKIGDGQVQSSDLAAG